MVEPSNREYLVELLVTNLTEAQEADLADAGLKAKPTETGYTVAVVAATQSEARMKLHNLTGIALDSMKLAET